MKARLKAVRKAVGLTQQEFADRLGIKRGAVANYEIGRNDPIDAVISLICREFGVNETWLRTGEGEMFAPVDPENQLMEWAGRVLADSSDGADRQGVGRAGGESPAAFGRRKRRLLRVVFGC